jgi:hypothetical protein
VKWFRRGRHRRNRFSVPVRELIVDCKRIPITDLFAMHDEIWSRR